MNDNQEIEQEVIERPEDEVTSVDGEDNPAPADDDGELVVTIDGEEEPSDAEEKAPEWVRDLRKQHRELQRENRELRSKMQTAQVPAEVTLGEKPTLEASDWDAEAYERKLAEWMERKRQVEAKQSEVQEAQRKQAEAWNQRIEAYATRKAELKAPDYDEAEEVVQSTLSQVQQGIIVQGARDPALIVYALGKNPKKAKELAAIADPVQFAIAIGELSAGVTMQKRKAPPPTDRPVSSSSAGGSVGSTARLEQLRNKARETGDYSEVAKYKASMKK